MKIQLPRRSFLQAAGIAAASTLAGVPSAGAHPAESDDKRPRMLSGCCAYSYRAYLDLKIKKMTMQDFILMAIDLGIDGVDLTTYYLESTEPNYLHSLRHLAFKHGIPFSGTAIRTEMCQPDPAKRAEQFEGIKKWVDATELLGASHIRVFGGNIPKGATDEQAVGWTAETMKQACDYSATKGITLGIESHGGITARASNILAILKQVDNPYAGCNLDISHFDGDPYPQIEALVPYATHSHIKSMTGGKNPEPLDLERIWKMFANGGYQGFMSVEYEGGEDAMTGVPKIINQVKELCRKYSSV